MSGTTEAGIRARVAVRDPDGCPVATASAAADGQAGDVSWTGGSGGEVTEQFRLSDPDGDPPGGVDRVFDVGRDGIYQFERSADGSCVCETVESLSCPVSDVRGVDGSLVLTLHLDELDRLREVVGRLRERYDGVTVRYLARDGAGDGSERLVPVDLGRLTDRQREVLETAHGMGYFEYPRGANASEVAAALDIGPSTLIEHLTAAQSKLLGDLLDGEAP